MGRWGTKRHLLGTKLEGDDHRDADRHWGAIAAFFRAGVAQLPQIPSLPLCSVEAPYRPVAESSEISEKIV
jgi:hypothetical protein